MRVFIDVESFCTSSEREDEEFGSWKAHYNSDVIGCYKEPVKNKYLECHEVSDSKEEVDSVYIIWVIYSSGDSFGRSYGNIKVAGVSHTPEEKDRILQSIKDETHPDHCTWGGHFASIEAIHWRKFFLDGNNSEKGVIYY